MCPSWCSSRVRRSRCSSDLRLIQVQRQDFNGRVITVRGDDTRGIAAMLDVPVDQVADRLAALDLLFKQY